MKINVLIGFLTPFDLKMRDEAAVVRQEGARRNGSERVGFKVLLLLLEIFPS